MTRKQSVKTTGRPDRPEFRGDKVAEEFWQKTVDAYAGYFSREDSALLTLAAQAWSRYSEAYQNFELDEENAKAEARMFKWFDRFHKMLVALGMTPCQRKNLTLPPTEDSAGSVTRRGE